MNVTMRVVVVALSRRLELIHSKESSLASYDREASRLEH
jgi:hypothetical protein